MGKKAASDGPVGVILLNKEKDFTSFDAVALMRGILKTRRVGHGGTLDPMAEGVLPVFVGDATKLCDFLPYEDKCYEAEMTLGLVTDTEDIWGNVLEEHEITCTAEEAVRAVLSFVGEIDQIPPMYSAKKINGQKLYQLARQGIVVERKPERVSIGSIEILEVRMPVLRFRVSCSKGTYIRSLCRDIGEKLGCGACMSALLRTRHGNFDISAAHTLKEVEEIVKAGELSRILIPVSDLFPDLSVLKVTESGEKALSNGNILRPDQIEDMPESIEKGTRFRICDTAEVFRAVYSFDVTETEGEGEAGHLRPVKMFLGDMKKS